MADSLRIVPSSNEDTRAEGSRGVRVSRERAAALRTEDLLTELASAVERLQAAEEALRVQSEALSAARDELERERAARVGAEQAARSGAELTARLTRELRASLDTSSGYAELIRSRIGLSSGAGGEMQRAAAESIVALHEYMLGLVADAGRIATCAAAALSSSTTPEDAPAAPAAAAARPAV